MFSNAPTTRLDFADTRAFVADTTRAKPAYSRMETTDAADLLAGAEADDLHLLRLVGCAALATLLLALAAGLSL